MSLLKFRRISKKAVILIAFLNILIFIMCLISIYRSDKEIKMKCWGGVINCGNPKKSEYIDLKIEKKALDLKDQIYFVKGYGESLIDPRMWCSIESAAKSNKDNEVKVLFNNNKLLKTYVTQQVMENYPNIKIVQLNLTKLFEHSPLSYWYENKLWLKSFWPNSHFNDALR